MNTTIALINDYLTAQDDQREPIANSIAGDLKDNGLLYLVKLMGIELTSSDDLVRAQATRCLTHTLKYIHSISRQEQVSLVEFFSNRLEDPPSVSFVLTGFDNLCVHASFSKSVLSPVLEALSRLRARELAKEDRLRCFGIMHRLVHYRHPHFLATYVALASGEKEPSCLLVCFEIDLQVLHEYQLTPAESEDLFDITFCYFPVTFTPPKDSPQRATADSLKARLREIISSPHLADYVVPALLAKLAAISIGVKIDVLHTLEQLLHTLDARKLHELWPQVWNQIKDEVIHGSIESDTFKPALAVLSSLTRIGDEFVQAVVSEFHEERAVKYASQLGCLVVHTTFLEPELFQHLAAQLLDVLLSSETPNLQPVLECVNNLFESPFCMPYLDRILALTLSALKKDTDDSVVAVATLKLLAQRNEEYVALVVQSLVEALASQRLKQSAVAALGSIAVFNSAPVASIAVPFLLAKVDQELASNVPQRSLETLTQICLTKDLVYTLTSLLVARLESIALIEDVHHPRQTLAVLSALHRAASCLNVPALSGFDRLVLPLVARILALHAASHVSTFDNEIVIDAVSQLAEVMVRGVPERLHLDYGTRVVGLFVGSVNVVEAEPNILFPLFVSCVCALKTLPPSFAPSCVDMALRLSRTRSVHVRSGYLRFLCLVANKWPQVDNDTDLYVRWLEKNIETELNTINYLETLAWVAKGLVIKADARGFELANTLLGYVCDRKLGPAAARVFGVLVASDRIVCKENNVMYRQLFRQRLMLQLLDKVLAGFQSPDHRNEMMLVLAWLMRFAPFKVLVQQMNKILPYILESMASPIASVQLASVNAVLVALPEAVEVFVPHLPQVIPQVLRLARNTENDVRVRTSAVKMLARLAEQLGKQGLEGYAIEVLDGLVPVLGDPLRDVRAEASRCRQLYYFGL